LGANAYADIQKRFKNSNRGAGGLNIQQIANGQFARAADTITDAWTSIRRKRRAIRYKWRLWDAKWHRTRSGATFIAVTGSSGKTTTAAILSHILSGSDQTFCQFRANGLTEAVTTLRRLEPSDKYAVFECGTGKPGDILPMAQLIKPTIAIVTMVAIEHYSAFRTLAAIAAEKASLLEPLSAGGLAILNFDDPLVRAMAANTKARVVGFGQHNGDYRVSNPRLNPQGELALTITPPTGQTLELATRLLGKYSWLPVAAAAVCALEMGISPELIVARLETFQPMLGRMSVEQIPQGPRFILDTQKAPWFSLMLPLEVIREIEAPRKRIVLGQISDYAGNSRSKYRNACRAALEVADEVILVGPNSHKFSTTDEGSASPGRFKGFPTIKECAEYIRQSAVEDEVILLKSAKNLHLERIWLNFVDDVQCWPTECGVKNRRCFDCLFRVPFAEHGAAKNYPRKAPYQQRLCPDGKGPLASPADL